MTLIVGMTMHDCPMRDVDRVGEYSRNYYVVEHEE